MGEENSNKLTIKKQDDKQENKDLQHYKSGSKIYEGYFNFIISPFNQLTESIQNKNKLLNIQFHFSFYLEDKEPIDSNSNQKLYEQEVDSDDGFECRFCHRKFTQKGNMNKHLKQHLFPDVEQRKNFK